MAGGLRIWKAAPASCKTDAVLTHILSKDRAIDPEDADVYLETALEPPAKEPYSQPESKR